MVQVLDGVGHSTEPVKVPGRLESSISGDPVTLAPVETAAHTRRRVIGRVVFLVVTLIAFYFVLPGLLATFSAPPAPGRLPGLVRRRARARSRELRRDLGAPAHRPRNEGLVRRRVLPHGGERGRSGRAGRRRGGRRAPAQDARPGRLRHPHRDHRARRRRAALDRHPVRVAGARTAGSPVRRHQPAARRRRPARGLPVLRAVRLRRLG